MRSPRGGDPVGVSAEHNDLAGVVFAVCRSTRSPGQGRRRQFRPATTRPGANLAPQCDFVDRHDARPVMTVRGAWYANWTRAIRIPHFAGRAPTAASCCRSEPTPAGSRCSKRTTQWPATPTHSRSDSSTARIRPAASPVSAGPGSGHRCLRSHSPAACCALGAAIPPWRSACRHSSSSPGSRFPTLYAGASTAMPVAAGAPSC